MLVAMTLVFAVIAARLTDVQAVATRRYSAYGQDELLHTVSLPGLRGNISDRSGAPLAMSVPETNIVADDFQVAQPDQEAAALAPILAASQASLQAALSQRAGFVYIARQVDDATTAKIKALDLPGISFEPDPERFLPDGSLGLPLIGQVNAAGNGSSGLEYQYNRLLAGRPGSAVVAQDPSGRTIPNGIQSAQPAQPGHGLVLSLDPSIQYDTEQALGAEMTASHAADGMAVVMSSRTGDILAMANLSAGAGPASTPAPAASALGLTSVFEPGSVAKVAVFGAALAQGLISPQTILGVPPQLKLGGATFSDAEPHGYERLSATDVLAQSSNVGTIEIAQQLGPTGTAAALRAVGWGQPTGLGFPGESAGILTDPAHWSGSDIGSVAIGQSSAVTAMQVADTYNILANGGTSVAPRLVTATVDPSGVHHPSPRAPGHQVFSPQVALELTGMLEDVVGPNGTAPRAAVPGYTVAGKTGTAQIPSPNGGYQAGAFMATFAGFVPAENPALTIVVSLEHPTPDYFGGDVAAPVFSQIAQYALRRLAIPPSPAASAALGQSSSATTIAPSGPNRAAP